MQLQTDIVVRDGVVESLWTDFMSCWERLPNKALFLGLLLPWFLLFQFLGNSTFGYIDTPSLFKWLWVVHTQSADESEQGPGMLAPLLVAALFWLKRKELVALELRSWSVGMFILGGALAIHILGYLVQQPRLSIVAFFLGVYAIMGMAWGPRWLWASFFPFFLFAFMLPLQGAGAVVTSPLRIMATMIVEFVSRNLLGIDVVRVGTGLFDSAYSSNPQMAYQYDVAPACSGLRSLTAMFFIATAYGYWLFRASWRWLVFLVAAFPLAVIGNVIRLLLIVLAAEVFGKAAGDWVHENALISLLPYVPVILGLMGLARWLEPRNREENRTEAGS
jgi:exosortase